MTDFFLDGIISSTSDSFRFSIISSSKLELLDSGFLLCVILFLFIKLVLHDWNRFFIDNIVDSIATLKGFDLTILSKVILLFSSMKFSLYFSSGNFLVTFD